MIGKKVLLIDEDARYLKLAGLVFKKAGAEVITACNSMEGISKVLAHQPDLIILDIRILGKDGLQVYQEIRQLSRTPLIMLSALDQAQSMQQGLEAGADDFLTKPINPEILLARARTVLRRNQENNGHQTEFNYDDGRLKIDVEKHRVQIKNKRIKLTPVEFRLLVYLASNADRVLSFKKILANVWEGAQDGNNSYVHVYISHLRSKIEEEAKSPRYIHSVHGVGYIFERQVMPSFFEKALESLAID